MLDELDFENIQTYVSPKVEPKLEVTLDVEDSIDHFVERYVAEIIMEAFETVKEEKYQAHIFADKFI